MNRPRPGAAPSPPPPASWPCCTSGWRPRRGADGILDVAYRTVDSPVGSLLLAATEQGLIRVAYARENHEAVLQSLADQISPRILHAPGRLEAAARELASTSPASGAASTCHWTCGCRPGSGVRC